MKSITFIYALKEPDTGEIRYVGKSDSPKERFKQHVREAKKGGTHNRTWILSLQKLGLLPVLEVLDSVPSVEWDFWEREYIRLFKALGFRLTNTTEGGDGVFLRVPGFTGKRHSEESNEKNRLAHLGKKRPPEECEKISLALRKRSAEVRDRAASKLRGIPRPVHAKPSFAGRKHSLESRLKMSESAKKRRVA